MPNLCNEKALTDNMNRPDCKISEQSIILNFRDVSRGISAIKPNTVFRTSSLTEYQDDNTALNELRKIGIRTVIDLRAEREVQMNPYSDSFQSEFDCINIPLDPWSQPEWFVAETSTIYCDLSNAEKAYYFFIKCCQNQIKIIFEFIANTEDSTAIHCVAGKDRAGLIIILIGMLLGSNYKELLADYLESEQDTDENKFRIFYDYVVDVGGIHKYLYHCGISKDIISNLKLKLAK
ncbi:MAG: hypothetical protein GQ564_22360 [Bacteroidales bacterium]|nr:hypothetical protein [Bacteroidales bacterium]